VNIGGREVFTQAFQMQFMSGDAENQVCSWENVTVLISRPMSRPMGIPMNKSAEKSYYSSQTPNDQIPT